MSPMPVEKLRGRVTGARLPRPGTNPERVLDFLRADEGQGWRAVELSATLEMDPNTIGSVLRRLRSRGLVDMIDEHWFALADDEIAKRHAMLITTRLANEKLGPEDPDDWPTIPQEE